MALEDILPDIINAAGLSVANLNVTSQEDEMKQIVALISQAGDDIAKRASWSKMFRQVDIPANQTSFALPVDFQKMVDGGSVIIKGGAFEPIRVIIDPATWGFVSRVGSGQHYCHISGPNLLISPNTGYAGATLSYVSTNWLKQGASYSNKVIADDQETSFPEHLLITATLWRWNRLVGLPFDDLAAEFEANFTTALNSDRGGA